MNRISNDLRIRAVEDINNGISVIATSLKYRVCRQTLYSWRAKNKEGKLLEVNKSGGGNKKIDWDSVIKYFDEKPTAYLREAAEDFKISINSVFRILRKYNYVDKKGKKTI
jgi:transposase-like protein